MHPLLRICRGGRHGRLVRMVIEPAQIFGLLDGVANRRRQNRYLCHRVIPPAVRANVLRDQEATSIRHQRGLPVCLAPTASVGAFSKSSEEDNEAGELDEAEEVLSVVLPADEDATLPLYPGEEPLDEPSPRVTA